MIGRNISEWAGKGEVNSSLIKTRRRNSMW